MNSGVCEALVNHIHWRFSSLRAVIIISIEFNLGLKQMVFKAIQRWLAVSLSVLVLAACNGGDVGGFNELRDLRLSNLEVVEGGTLMFQEDTVEEFDQNNFGPYRVALTNESVSSITLRSSFTVENVNLQLVEVNKGENLADIVRDIDSGEEVSVNIREGSNVILVRMASTINNVVSEYVLQVNKVSSSSALGDVVIQNVRSSNSNNNIRYEPSSGVAADVFTYSVAVAQNNCGVSFFPIAVNRLATVTINGESFNPLQNEFIPLENNVSTPVVVRIVSEDKTNTAEYTFNLTRAASSAEDIASDSTLNSIEVSSARTNQDFRCSTFETPNQIINNDVTAVTLEAATNRSGSTMTIGRARLVNGTPQRTNGRLDTVDPETLTSGQAFDGALLQNLAVGNNFFVITVTAADNETISAYLVNIQRLSTNEVFVENAEQLQQALRNASPNDDIVVASGDYIGVVSDAMSTTGSGDASAHFFSAASGTEDQPIRLRREGRTPVRLMGSGLNQNAVLKLTGDRWEISTGFEVSQAQNGLVLDSANNILVEGLGVASVGERGIVIQNGSSNNQIRLGTIDKTGLAPQTRDGITEVYGEAVVIGAGDMASNGNSVRNMTFGRNIANEVIDIKSNAGNTTVQFNIFSSDNTIVRPFANRSIISTEAAATEISYNQFEYNDIASGTDDISQFILTNIAAGSTTEVFQNIINLDQQAINFVNSAGAGEADVADTTRQDSGDVLFTGSVDQTFVTPSFQIRSTLNSNNCLTAQDIVITRDSSAPVNNNGVVIAACDNSESQLWTFTLDDDGYVFISPKSSLSTKVAPFNTVNGTDGASAITLAINRADNSGVLDSSFLLRWRMLIRNNQVVFSNRGLPLVALTEAPNLSVTGLGGDNQPLFVKVPVSGETAIFTLVRQ